ncbi:unnamed protein product [Parascedosporium putredinis]|uniref:Uncharacterized protein n=1 Tax=Parascedosporium putredinis TaxID=1442378 RepID=A0A9P1GX31_9PEZI|nr:unnamed protein product [Parascedosporium putredinis]CAI7989379.1 unnamed protein product [Parascedosporium putredinis]
MGSLHAGSSFSSTGPLQTLLSIKGKFHTDKLKVTLYPSVAHGKNHSASVLSTSTSTLSTVEAQTMAGNEPKEHIFFSPPAKSPHLV